MHQYDRLRQRRPSHLLALSNTYKNRLSNADTLLTSTSAVLALS